MTQGFFRVHIVDNGSTDGTREYLAALHDPRVTVIALARNMGVSVAANVGWAADEEASFYVKLDNDIEILKGDWLRCLLEYAADSKLGMVGYRFLKKHTITELKLANGSLFWDFSSCGGACCCISQAVHQKLGFWNEDYGHYGFEDLEYGQRCRLLNLMTGYLPYEDRVRHLGYTKRDEQYEIKKQTDLEQISGKKMYFINKLLFEQKIRPLKVTRRYLPYEGTYPLRFKPNPAYHSILLLLNELQKTVPYTREKDIVSLDLSKWKQ